MHLNSVQLIGRIGKKRPEWGYTASGAATCHFTLEVDEPSKSGEVFTLYLPVEIWGQAERAVELLEPGDEVMLSGKLKYKSVLDSKTQQKSSKLIVSSWGIQQRAESPQDERTDVDEGDTRATNRRCVLSQRRDARDIRSGNLNRWRRIERTMA
jgi:single-stranded DNA-binding protein